MHDCILRLFAVYKMLYLIITHYRYYNVMNNFNRLLLLLSNEVMIKSRDVVGPKVLSDPEMVCILSNIKHISYLSMHTCVCVFLCMHMSVCLLICMYVHNIMYV